MPGATFYRAYGASLGCTIKEFKSPYQATPKAFGGSIWGIVLGSQRTRAGSESRFQRCGVSTKPWGVAPGSRLNAAPLALNTYLVAVRSL
jgi:hypothetical protein